MELRDTDGDGVGDKVGPGAGVRAAADVAGAIENALDGDLRAFHAESEVRAETRKFGVGLRTKLVAAEAHSSTRWNNPVRLEVRTEATTALRIDLGELRDPVTSRKAGHCFFVTPQRAGGEAFTLHAASLPSSRVEIDACDVTDCDVTLRFNDVDEVTPARDAELLIWEDTWNTDLSFVCRAAADCDGQLHDGAPELSVMSADGDPRAITEPVFTFQLDRYPGTSKIRNPDVDISFQYTPVTVDAVAEIRPIWDETSPVEMIVGRGFWFDIATYAEDGARIHGEPPDAEVTSSGVSMDSSLFGETILLKPGHSGEGTVTVSLGKATFSFDVVVTTP